MDAQQVSILVITCILGPAILGSYVPIYQDQKSGKHDYWLQIPSTTQYLFYAFWLLAAIGFIWYVLSVLIWTSNDNAGLFSYGAWVRPVLIALLLIAALGWSLGTWTHFHKGASKGWASASLVVTAICTILLLAGEAESNAPWHRILGLMAFAFTVVLIDPVMWNAKWLIGTD